jgi:hypothetical protein
VLFTVMVQNVKNIKIALVEKISVALCVLATTDEALVIDM